MPITTLTTTRVTWTNILQPTPADMRELSARYTQFHPLNLEDCLTDLEFPKIDPHENHLFMVMQLPLYDEKLRVSRPQELDVFIAKGTLVTVHRGGLPALDALWELAQTDEDARKTLMGRGASPLLYDILNALVNDCAPFVQRVKQQVRHIENNLFDDNTRHLLNEIAILRRDVSALRRILRPQPGIMKALELGKWPFIQNALHLYWSDIGDSFLQYLAVLDEYHEVTHALAETVDTLASHRIDEVVRVLTLATVLTLPFSLIAALFGMNVVLPFGDHPFLFYTIIVGSFSLTGGILWYMRRKRWF